MPGSNLSRAVLLLVLVGVLLFVGIWGVSATIVDISDETAVNETVNQSGTQSLDADGDRYRMPIVENESRDLDAGVDYEFDQQRGDITFNESTGDNVTVETTAVSMPGNTAAFVPLLDRFLQIGAFLPLVFGAGAILIGIGKLRDSNRGGAY